VHPEFHRGGRRRRNGAAAALAALVFFPGCSEYKQTHHATMTIWDVRVTKNARDVEDCRLLGDVDSRDDRRGCGSTVQPTPEECLRYQVRYAGGDTLLINGPIGKAYDCSGEPPAAEPTVAASGAPAPAAPLPTPTRSPEPAPSEVPAPSPPTAEPRPSVRITAEREAAKGCIYLGDVPASVACQDRSAECIDQAIRAGGDLVVVEAGRAQIFACRRTP
jgi:ribosomal protein L32